MECGIKGLGKLHYNQSDAICFGLVDPSLVVSIIVSEGFLWTLGPTVSSDSSDLKEVNFLTSTNAVLRIRSLTHDPSGFRDG